MENNEQKKEQEGIVMYAVESKKPYVVSKKQSTEFHAKSEQCTRNFERVFTGAKIKTVKPKGEVKK